MHLMLLSPIMIVLFALTLGGLWLADRRRTHLLLLAAGFGGFATAMLIQVVQLPPQPAFSVVVSTICYVGGATLIALGVSGRAGRTGIPPPLIVLPLLIVAGQAWFSYVDNQLLVRIYVLNFGFGAIFLLGTWYARGLATRSFADRVLFWLLLGFALHFFPRIVLTAASVVGITDPQRFAQSPFWTTTIYVSSIFSVLIGLALVLATVADLVTRLQSERDTDTLTGTLNRRGLDARVADLLAQPIYRPISLVACDIDHFKRVNDHFGHHAGDLVLERVGLLLRTNCRATDLVARIGGEEFVVVLPNTSGVESYELAERLRHKIAGAGMGKAGPRLSVTCSFGVAELHAGEDLWGGMRRADRLLYAAKHAGRNRTVAEGLDAPQPLPGPTLVGRGEPRLVTPLPRPS